MEIRVKNAFENVTMPEECAQKILWDLEHSTESRHGGWNTAQPVGGSRFSWLRTTAAAALLAVIVAATVMLWPRQEAHLSDAPATEATETIPQKNESIQYSGGNYTYQRDENGVLSAYRTDCSASWLKEENGRVYFVGNRENIDITDLISEEEPFTYIYEDPMGVVHYIAIGGTPDNLGYLEQFHLASDPGIMGGLGGYGVNTWNNETQSRYGWEQRAKEIFGEYGIYWVS